MKSAKWLCALFLVLVVAQSRAAVPVDADIAIMKKQGERFDVEFEEKPWSEVEAQLPPFPEKENLIPFRVGYITDKQFFIDGKSISVGADGVIRYTLVVVSDQGAQNVSYEGMRCSTFERRFYASGHSDKTWSKARSNKWVLIQGSSNSYHVEIFFNNFCVGGTSPPSVEEARRVLRQGGIKRY